MSSPARLTRRSQDPVVGRTVVVLGRVLDAVDSRLHLGESLVLGRQHDRLVLLVRVLIARRSALQESVGKVLPSVGLVQMS